MNELRVLADPEAGAAEAAERIIRAAVPALESRGGFRLALSGGRTPERLYRLLASPTLAARVDWSRVDFLFSDERDVPPTDPESNYWMARKLLLEPVGARPERVHRMKADAPDLESAAHEYETRLEKPLDVLLLGVGADGHTASIFPGSMIATERARRVAAVRNSPKPPPRRLTLTPRAIGEAAEIIVLATGSDKAEAMGRVFESGDDVVAVPARLVRHASWLVDRAAAMGLAERR